jgi:formylglycine-generating enzyme required for sulfatase activity
MPRFPQHPLRWSCLGAALFIAATLRLGTLPAEQPTDDGPKVDKLEIKGYTEKVKGSFKDPTDKLVDVELKFDMVPIPGGTFMMGSPDSEKGRNADEGPRHRVTIRPFWMGKCEVTWDEFDLFIKEKGLKVNTDFDEIRAKDPDAITGPTPPYGEGGAPDYDHGHNGHPAICMTQHAAMEYCRWLSAKTGKAYRLPTEAEWEWAARAGAKTTYFFGDDPKELKEYAWYSENSGDKDHEDGTTHKVGTKKPNPWGLYDIYGNVSEWTLDHYKKDYYADCLKDKLTLGPVLLPGPDRFPHVVRGGSFADEAVKCRSATRRGSDGTWIKYDPQRPRSIWWLTRMDVIGFRVVRAVTEQDNLKNIKSKVTRQSKMMWEGK